MAGFVHGANHGQLAIAAGSTVNLMAPAWRCMNLVAVKGKQVRGTDLVTPNVAGRTARGRVLDSLIVGLEMIVRGDCTTSGTAVGIASRFTQLDSNTDALAAIAIPPSGLDGWTATYTAAGASPKTGEVFVENWQVSPDSDGLRNRVTFDLVLVGGVWV